jgi:hypothetical protein
MKTDLRSRSARRGSLLIVAMIICAVIGISLTSYLTLGRTGMNISNRALYNNGAMNLAENGLEYSLFAINKKSADSTYSWTDHGWTAVGTNDARREWSGYNFDQNARGTVRAYVYDATGGAAPRIVTRSRVSLGDGRTIEKWIEVRLRKTSKFANGLVAKRSITFSGNNASVDSWNSDPDNDPTTAAIKYDTTTPGVRRDNGSVGSISVSVDAIAVNNADIWGYAATGGALPSVGSQGRVGPFGQANGTMDMTRVSTDFSASFDPVSAPSTYSYSNYGGVINNDETLPRGTDPVSPDGYYYITADSINFNNKLLIISNKVILKLTNASTAIDMAGSSAEIRVLTGAELQVYGPGDMKIAGNGLTNGGTTNTTVAQPVKCQFYGTKTSGVQDIQIAGNGVLSAIVYAPQGSVKINGNGDVSGSVVANDITVVGNAIFHYDESLANFGGNNPYRVSLWKELTTAADRNTVSSILNW